MRPNSSLERTRDTRPFIFPTSISGGRNFRLVHEKEGIIWKNVRLIDS